jgi:flavin reductase (DIM6/NTAB) family NADH-FMN oxidoreductase RutF
MTIDPKDITLAKLTGLLQGSISPRPIAFASTVDKNGNVNLSPFSFFNLVSLNPPMLLFSVSRRIRDNTTKHTYENILEVPEVAVNIVNYNMVQQTSLASTEYAKGINEFHKAGLTPLASQKIKPPRVAESPVAFECLVRQIIPLAETPGAGNLIICEIVLAHFSDDIFDDTGTIDPFKIDTVARMGGDWYCRAQGNAIFKVPKPLTTLGIGVDQIPQSIRLSKVLTGNDLGMLGNTEYLPDATSIHALRSQPEVAEALSKGEEAIHQLAKLYLQEGKVMEAWSVLLLSSQ